MPLLRSIRVTLDMIKWEHSIFALPFALTGAMLASHGWPPLAKLLWIVVCMVSARSAAMAFNRWADADLDAANPRTRTRAIPAGLLTRNFTAAFTVVMSALSSSRRRTPQRPHPRPLARRPRVLFLYSYTKRFTRWSHLVLGLALGIAPTAAWIAVRGSLDPRILVLTAAVTLLGRWLRRPLRLPG